MGQRERVDQSNAAEIIGETVRTTDLLTWRRNATLSGQVAWSFASSRFF
jgi:hypothetical protein